MHLCIQKLTGLELSIALTAILSLTFIGVSFSVPLLTPIALENFTTTAGAASSVMGFYANGHSLNNNRNYESNQPRQ